MNRLCRWLFSPTLLIAVTTVSASEVDQLVARGIARARATPTVPAPLSLLVTGGAPDLHIRSVRTWIDGAELLRYEYSDVEAEALAGAERAARSSYASILAWENWMFFQWGWPICLNG